MACSINVGEPLEPFEFLDCAQAARCTEFSHDGVLAALVVRGRSEPSRRFRFQFDPFKETVEREIEIQAGLLAVSNHVQAGCDLIVKRRNDSVILQLGAVCRAEVVQMLAGKFEPTRKRVTTDDGGA
jgi:hypothetical protein